VSGGDGTGIDGAADGGAGGGVTGADWPEGLRAAFDAYEMALMADDVDALDALFEPGSDTIRGDGAGLLVGHDRISAFRSSRGGVARRTIGRAEVRALAPDAVLVVAESRFDGGGRGLQTQLWRFRDRGWRIAAAHVTGRAPALDRTIWRVVGDPLVRGAAGDPLVRGAEDVAAGAADHRPLAGVRLAVKDLFAVAGHVVGAGNPRWERSAPVETATAPAVRALLDAGADIVGIARTDEFAYSIAGSNAHSGTPPNGAAPERIPGGSTSGPASAVATGVADLAIGTDTGGSVRVPASYQGLWGIRTTHGAVDRTGLLPLAQTFDTVGWLARDPATLRAAAATSLPAAPRSEDVAGPRTAPGFGGIDHGSLLVADQLLDAASPATHAAFTTWLDALADRGVAVERVVLPPLDVLAETLRLVQGAEAWRNDGAWVTAHPDALGPDIAGRFRMAASITVEQERDARTAMTGQRARIRDVLGGRVLCLPTVPGPAPLRTETDAIQEVRTATLRMTSVAGIGGLPAVSAPFLTVAGAPVGVCLVGPVGSDLALIDLAASWR